MNGEWIEIWKDEGGVPYVTDELFFRGHCEEVDLDWLEVAERTDYYERFDEELPDDELASRLRDDYGRLQHVYGRKVPTGDGCWRWMWQRHCSRGAFKVTRLVEKSWSNRRRLRRRRLAAARRAALDRWPDAEIVAVWSSEPRATVRMRFDGLDCAVSWVVGDDTVMVSRADVDVWKERYQGAA